MNLAISISAASESTDTGQSFDARSLFHKPFVDRRRRWPSSQDLTAVKDVAPSAGVPPRLGAAVGGDEVGARALCELGQPCVQRSAVSVTQPDVAVPATLCTLALARRIDSRREVLQPLLPLTHASWSAGVRTWTIANASHRGENVPIVIMTDGLGGAAVDAVSGGTGGGPVAPARRARRAATSRVRWRAGLPRYGLSSLVIAELVRDVPRGRPPSARGDVTKND